MRTIRLEYFDCVETFADARLEFGRNKLQLTHVGITGTCPNILTVSYKILDDDATCWKGFRSGG